MPYNNLTKLANAMKQQSEQEKKPSKATYLPALAGLYAIDEALVRSGQEEIEKLQDSLEEANWHHNFHDNSRRRFRKRVMEYQDKWNRKAGDPDLMKFEELLSEHEKEELFYRKKQKLYKKKLRDAKTLRNKRVAGGLGLLGLGVGATALLRRRKKRKQEQR